MSVAPAPAARPRVKPRRRLLLPRIDDDRCTGCGRCVAACEPKVLWLEARGWEKGAVLHDVAHCTGCAACFRVCPFDAVAMRR